LNRSQRVRTFLFAAAVAAATELVAVAVPAQAAVSLTVTTTADVASNAGDCGSTSTTVPSPLSLREATCIANNYGNTQAVTINVPAGTYTLANGELQMGKVNGSNITLNGAGSASTIIDGQHASRVLDLDPAVVGGVTTSISGVTITNGRDGTFGGAGIIAGSGGATALDTLNVANSVLSNNQANFAVPTASSKPGGGISVQGGNLTLTNDTFTGNQSFSSAGAAVSYMALGSTAGQTLTVNGSTFSGNTTANSGASGTSGGALAVSAGAGGGTYTVTNSTFTGNGASSSTAEAAAGGAIFQMTGNLTVTGSTFTGNSVSGGGTLAGGPVIYTAGTTAMHYNRFVGNTGTGGVMTNSGSGVADVTENWWGCNTGPNTTGCETTSGTGITATPRLVLMSTASPSHVTGPNGTSTITASLLTDSNGGAVGAANLAGAFNGVPVSFADPPGDATVTLASGAHSVNISGGTASIDYHSNTTLGPDNVSTTFDNATTAATLEVDQAPAITSANTAPFTVGTAGSFTVTTTGYPAAAITKIGSLPSGLTFTDNGNGSATISGTPAAGTGGNYTMNLTAANGVSPNANKTLTVNVSQAPGFTSGSTATFVTGSAGVFNVTTSGFPTVSTITESGTLPAGVTFTDNGNGTATLAGTPTGNGNTYPVTLTASNGVSPNGTQNLTIQVNQAPAVTLNPTDQTVAPGNSVSFTAAASGVPNPTVQWQRSTDSGASFVNIAGATSTTYTFTTAAGDSGNEYRAVFSNGVGSPATTTAATLTVGTAPSFTSADHTSFVVGQAGSFSITTTGVPSATLSRAGTQFPTWLTLTDNGDGTGSLTGTPPAGSGGTYQFTLKAANGVGTAASQNFTLFVDDSPVITSGDHTTFTVGSAGSFAVTTTAGFPTTTSITKSGSLPSGVGFTDNGDGTATLAGTPAAGTGGSYPITITATAVGGLAAPATQSFTLTVLAPPTITSADHSAFSEGSAGSFTVTTTAGNPTATTISTTGTLPAGLSFSDNGDGTATVAGTPDVGSRGTYTVTITASNGVAPDSTQTFTVTVNAPPAITSADHVTFTVGVAASFTVTTTGQPTPALSETGTLPPGTTFTDDGDGTATLGGTPTSGGSYSFTITASNGVLPDATQAFTVTVDQPPVMTSADHTTFAVGSPGTFTVTSAAGTPAATTITKSGSLPPGVSFTDNGDGTATMAGTPVSGTGGSYPLTITASNGVLPDSTQSFTLTVTELPAVTSTDHTTLTVGSAGTFTVTTTPGFPTATTITEVGSLPSGVSFTDNGDGTATLAGTPAAGASGSYPLTLTATNTAGHTDQAFTLTVSNATQTITVTSVPPSPAYVGGSYPLAATASSGLPVSYTLDAATTATTCSLSGDSVSLDHAGTCVIDFDQAGDGTWAAAPQVQQSFAVTTVPTTVALTASPTNSVYGQPATATATIGAASGTPAGTVTFSVDGTQVGTPVTVVSGAATSETLTDGAGQPLAPGTHTVAATFIPDDQTTYADSTSSVDTLVDKAATTSTVSVAANAITATVGAVTPGAGTPTGTVTFAVNGTQVGTAPLANGTATLPYTVPTGHTQNVSVAYAGDADFTGSSASTARHDPTITAHLSSATSRTRYGWYRSPVTVTFTCTPAGAPLTAACPAPVRLAHQGAAQSVTRTITATDGGSDTATVNVSIDMTAPSVRVAGVRNGAVYRGVAPKARCVGRDALSGIAKCTLRLSTRGEITSFRAVAVDRAGNRAITRGHYRTLRIWFASARYSAGAFDLHPGHSYTLYARAATRPVYYDPVVAPLTPTRADKPLFATTRSGTWAISVHIPAAMRHGLWHFAVRIGRTLHQFNVRIG
jgi:hypothetical protein